MFNPGDLVRIICDIFLDGKSLKGYVFKITEVYKTDTLHFCLVHPDDVPQELNCPWGLRLEARDIEIAFTV